MPLEAHLYPSLSEIKSKFEQFCPDEISQLIPCSDRDVAVLEEQLSLKLPKIYRDFLLWLGRGGGFLEASSNYNSLARINDAAREVVVRKAPHIELAKNAFVFCFDTAEQFWFFRCDEGENPRVYIFLDENQQMYIRGTRNVGDFSPEWSFLFDKDANKNFGLFSPSFTTFLNYELDIHIELKERIKAREQERRKKALGNN